MLEMLFTLCLFLIVYAYGLYPLIVFVLASFFRRDVREGRGMPMTTVIISAFNEEDIIAAKIENALELDYPKDLLEILVVSDHSTDRTDEIVQRYGDRGITLLAQPMRRGKTAGLNEAVKRAKGETVVFSDADSMYESDALLRMNAYLTGEGDIGLVTGSTRYYSMEDAGMVATTGMYTRFERFLKRQETRLGSCVGADGAIFAMRKELYQPLQDDDINDLVLPLQVVRQGFRVVFHGSLFCTEAPAATESGEFNRQARITNRTLRALFRNADLMNVFKYPLFGFELLSHKLLRFYVPFFMLSLMPLNALLLGAGLWYPVLFAVQLMIYSLCLFRYWQERTGRKRKRFGFLYHFVMVNVSMCAGWGKFLSGQKNVVWNPQRQ
jgi:cellulose synthase/poly-beta-1,6-N-acetylglucosamine synthase-like glycosyltransferase